MTINYMAFPGIKRSPEEVACVIWRVPEYQLYTSTRKRWVVEARQTLMVYRVDVLGESTTIAARRYNRDHATVIHAKKAISALLETDKTFKRRHDRFLAELAKKLNDKNIKS